MTMTQIELIAHYSKNLKKVLEDKNADSEYTTYAFFQLQGAKMGLDIKGIATFATKESERLHQIALANCN